MSDDEGFLRRWARRKAEAAIEVDKRAPAPPSPEPTDESTPAAPPAIDLAQLPSLDSITAETDIRGFLMAGVPAELSRAALRRAWLADPQIRDFIGIAENQWDFTATDELHGFGQLGVEEARKLVAEILGDGHRTPLAQGDGAMPEKATIPASPTAGTLVGETAGVPDDRNQQANLGHDVETRSQISGVGNPVESESPATEMTVEVADSWPRRSHGRALPE